MRCRSGSRKEVDLRESDAISTAQGGIGIVEKIAAPVSQRAIAADLARGPAVKSAREGRELAGARRARIPAGLKRLTSDLAHAEREEEPERVLDAIGVAAGDPQSSPRPARARRGGGGSPRSVSVGNRAPPTCTVVGSAASGAR